LLLVFYVKDKFVHIHLKTKLAFEETVFL